MIVIAMSDALGTQSKAVADAVCRRLGLAHVRHHNELQSFTPPARKPDIHFAGGVGHHGRTVMERPPARAELRRDLSREVLEMAAHGNVLVRGRCAPVILHSVGHVLRVRVSAPLGVRAREVMRCQGQKDEQAAAEMIRRDDAAYTELIEDFFATGTGDAGLYDVMLNTGRLSIEQCAVQVAELAVSPEFRPTAASKLMLETLCAEVRPGDGQGARLLGQQVPTPSAAMPLSFHDEIARAEEALYGKWLGERRRKCPPRQLPPFWD